MKISAVIITLNEELNLERCLRSLQTVVDEIVVVDSGSTDGTKRIAEKFQARWIEEKWRGYTEQKNFALSQALHDWVLSVDADEEFSPALQQSLQEIKREEQAVAKGYRVSRVVFYRGKWIYHGDWYPDRLVRLFHRGTAHFAGGTVHERLEITGGVRACPLLAGELRHYTYRDRQDRQQRIEKYADLWAEMAWTRGQRAGTWSAPLHGIARFLRGYVWRRGFLDGAIGWEIAMGNAREVFLKYHRLKERARA